MKTFLLNVSLFFLGIAGPAIAVLQLFPMLVNEPPPLFGPSWEGGGGSAGGLVVDATGRAWFSEWNRVYVLPTGASTAQFLTEGTFFNRQVESSPPATGNIDPVFTPFNNGMVFRMVNGENNSYTTPKRSEIWYSDGTPAGTLRIWTGEASVFVGPYSEWAAQPSPLVMAGGRVCWTHPAEGNIQLWSWDGTAPVTEALHTFDVLSDSEYHYPPLQELAGKLLIPVANEGSTKLWQVTPSTGAVVDLGTVGTGPAFVRSTKSCGGRLFLDHAALSSYSPGLGITEIRPAPENRQQWRGFTQVSNAVYFFHATDGQLMELPNLWRLETGSTSPTGVTLAENLERTLTDIVPLAADGSWLALNLGRSLAFGSFSAGFTKAEGSWDEVFPGAQPGVAWAGRGLGECVVTRFSATQPPVELYGLGGWTITPASPLWEPNPLWFLFGRDMNPDIGPPNEPCLTFRKIAPVEAGFYTAARGADAGYLLFSEGYRPGRFTQILDVHGVNPGAGELAALPGNGLLLLSNRRLTIIRGLGQPPEILRTFHAAADNDGGQPAMAAWGGKAYFSAAENSGEPQRLWEADRDGARLVPGAPALGGLGLQFSEVAGRLLVVSGEVRFQIAANGTVTNLGTFYPFPGAVMNGLQYGAVPTVSDGPEFGFHDGLGFTPLTEFTATGPGFPGQDQRTPQPMGLLNGAMLFSYNGSLFSHTGATAAPLEIVSNWMAVPGYATTGVQAGAFLYFGYTTTDFPGSAQLWRTGGTLATTSLVGGFGTAYSTVLRHFTAYGDRVIFSGPQYADEGENARYQLWSAGPTGPAVPYSGTALSTIAPIMLANGLRAWLGECNIWLAPQNDAVPPATAWAMIHGLSGPGAVPSADSDGDGKSNTQELLEWSNPASPLPPPASRRHGLELDTLHGGWLFRCPAGPLRRFRSVFLESSDNLSSWTPQLISPALTDDATLHLALPDFANGPNRYWRLRAED